VLQTAQPHVHDGQAHPKEHRHAVAPTLDRVDEETTQSKRSRTISLVNEDQLNGTATTTLIEQAAQDALVAEPSTLVGQWLITSQAQELGASARIAEAIVELDRFAIDPASLTSVGYHGKRLATLLEDFQRLRDSRTGTLGAETTPATQPWSRAVADVRLYAPTELSLLTQGAATDARLSIARWRSPQFDPSTKRMVDQLTQAGFSLSGHFQWEPQPRASTTIHQFADPDEEVAWVLAELTARLHVGEVTTDKIAIYAPPIPSYQRALRHYSDAFGLPLYRHERRRASLTTLGHHLMELVEFVQLGRVLGSAQRTRELADLLADLPTPPDGQWDDLASWLVRAMQRLFDHATLSSQVTPFDQQLLTQLIPHLERSPLVTRNQPTLVDLLGALSQLLNSLELDVATAHAGIRVVTSRVPVGQQTLVALLGAVDGHFPSVLNENPALPLAVRDRIHELPSTAELVRMQHVGAIGILQSARRDLIITGAKRIGSDRTLPSLLLEELDLHPTSAPPRYSVLKAESASLGADTTELGAKLARAEAIERTHIRQHEDSEFAGQVGALNPRILSPTQLEDLGQCPFRWFVKHYLRVSVPDEATSEPDPRQLGQLVHAALEQLVHLEPSSISHADVTTMLEALAPPPLRLRTPNWQPIRDEIATQLLAIANHPDFASPGSKPSVELELRGDWYGIPVMGRIDRLDEIGPGEYRIIDYKYSKSAPSGIQNVEARLTIDVQLSVYTKLVEQQLGHVVSATYCLVKKTDFVKAPGISKGETPALEAAAVLKGRLHSGDLPVAPDSERLTCKHCDYAQACRIASSNAG